MPPLAQLFPQVRVVVYFAVKDEDCVTVLALHGLVSAFEVDNSEANRPERDRLGLVEALLVRSAMCQGVGCTPDASCIHPTLVVCVTSYSAQIPVSSSSSRR